MNETVFRTSQFEIFRKYQVSENEMGRACTMRGIVQNCK